jgi:hypothetical protein
VGLEIPSMQENVVLEIPSMQETVVWNFDSSQGTLETISGLNILIAEKSHV